MTWTRAQRVHTSAVSAPSGPIAASYPVYEQLAVCSDWRQVSPELVTTTRVLPDLADGNPAALALDLQVQALWSKMRVETMSKDDIYCFLLQLQVSARLARPVWAVTECIGWRAGA